jgi:hypothetical protein
MGYKKQKLTLLKSKVEKRNQSTEAQRTNNCGYRILGFSL